MGRIAGILLAAGESRRMGFPKPLLKLASGETFIAHLTAAMLPAVDRLLVVMGAHKQRVIGAVPRNPRISVIENEAWPLGQLSSLRKALGQLAPEFEWAMVHLIDQPLVTAATFTAVANATRRGRNPIIIARHDGHRGHPVCFARSLFAELAAAPDSQGARVVVDRDSRRVAYVDVEDRGVSLDLDTPDDLLREGLPPPPTNGHAE